VGGRCLRPHLSPCSRTTKERPFPAFAGPRRSCGHPDQAVRAAGPAEGSKDLWKLLWLGGTPPELKSFRSEPYRCFMDSGVAIRILREEADAEFRKFYPDGSQAISDVSRS